MSVKKMLKNDYWVQNLGGFMREGGVINGSRFGQPIHADKSNTRTLHTYTYTREPFITPPALIKPPRFWPQ